MGRKHGGFSRPYGFHVGFDFTAVRASFVGVAPYSAEAASYSAQPTKRAHAHLRPHLSGLRCEDRKGRTKLPVRALEVMTQTRWSLIPTVLLAGAVAACGAEEPVPAGTTRAEIPGPAGDALRSADGLFELHFEEGALSGPTLVTIRTLRDQSVAGGLDSKPPLYEVTLSSCTVVRPDFVRASYQKPEALAWRGRLSLGAVAGERLAPEASSRMVDGAVEARASFTCPRGPSEPERRTFGLTAVQDEACVWDEPGTCGPCSVCSPGDAACQQPTNLVCAQGRCVAPDEIEPGACGTSLAPFPGWDDAPGVGRAFVLSEFRVAPKGVGFDLDNTCRGPGDCVDNSTWQLGELMNDQMRQAILGGELLYALELSGEAAHSGDGALTARFYVAFDADEPRSPTNNFRAPVGEEDCCEFLIEPHSLSGDPPRAFARAPARARAGAIQTLAPMRVDLRPAPIEGEEDYYWPLVLLQFLHRAYLSFERLADPDRIERGRLGGVMLMDELAWTPNPHCRTLNQLCPRQLPDSTMLDLFASILQPDIDLDGDGLELLEVGTNGRVERCRDGNGVQIPALVPDEPWTCALDPRMADGYSVAFEFTAVPAKLVGIRQR